MIGIDSANFGFARSNLDIHPNFARVLSRGVFRPLESSDDLISDSVWPSFHTGKSAGEHGVYHILQRDLQAMRLGRLSEDWFYCEPFWFELERAGLSAIVVDVAISFPTHPMQGIEVSNWASTTLSVRSPRIAPAWRATSNTASASIRWATKSR